ncbi:hypothetical protein LIER_42175 [Lithospermum erythrorhizon]|uniref:Uncharacterized protein n=1 Tax=Lithospermum erythrorhizon TaxID=34254 RepID=A0AAV3RKM6_LITER
MSSRPTYQEETALFTRKDGRGRGSDRGKEHGGMGFGDREQSERENQDRVFQSGGARGVPNSERYQNHWQREYRQSDEGYNCGKQGHYPRNFWSKRVEGNPPTSFKNESPREKDWDCEISFFVEEVDVVDVGRLMFPLNFKGMRLIRH